jgi:hypothetical protein
MSETSFQVQEDSFNEVTPSLKNLDENDTTQGGKNPVFMFEPEIERCPYCNEVLKSYYTSHLKPVITLEGKIRVQSKVTICKNSECPKHLKFKSKPMKIKKLFLPRMTYGIDVVAKVGHLFDVKHLNGPEIHEKLKKKHELWIPLSEIYEIYYKYEALLAGLNEERIKEVKERFQEQEGYVLTIDGTSSGGSDILIIIRDNMSDEVLLARVVDSESYLNLKPLIKEVIEMFGEPIAVISDMKPGILKAVRELLPNVKHQFCQRHFLDNVGNGLLKVPYVELSEELKKKRLPLT